MSIKYYGPENLARAGYTHQGVSQEITTLLRGSYGRSYYDQTLWKQSFVDNLVVELESGRKYAWLAIEDGEVVGATMIAVSKDGTEAELCKSVVIDRWRSNGVGKEIMSRRLPFIQENLLNVEVIKVLSRIVHPKSAAISLAQGFTPVACWNENPSFTNSGEIEYREPILVSEIYLRECPECALFFIPEAKGWIKGDSEEVGGEKELYIERLYDAVDRCWLFVNQFPDIDPAVNEEVVVKIHVDTDTRNLQSALINKGFTIVGFLPALLKRPPQLIFVKSNARKIALAQFPEGDFSFFENVLREVAPLDAEIFSP